MKLFVIEKGIEVLAYKIKSDLVYSITTSKISFFSKKNRRILYQKNCFL